MLVGVSTLASQVFRVVDYIEQPARHTRRARCGAVKMDVLAKLEILTDAAKYDAACTSSGVRPRVPGRAISATPPRPSPAAATPSPLMGGASRS